jgi:tRNA A37 threonylcarbamoyladenosine dehydratase
MFERTQLILGADAIETLKNSKVIVFGVGGVGGYVCEMLARTGVGEVTIVDDDVVTKSNLNRQIIALTSTIGRKKVEVMQERLKDINPSVKVNAHFKRFEESSKDQFLLEQYDYVIDAIDSLKEKFLLIKQAKQANANIVSAMGAGNRSGVPQFEICDIAKTTYDPLARKLRSMLKKHSITGLTVCYTKQQAKSIKPTASVAYYPSVCGITIASYVINELICKK